MCWSSGRKDGTKAFTQCRQYYSIKHGFPLVPKKTIAKGDFSIFAIVGQGNASTRLILQEKFIFSLKFVERGSLLQGVWR